MAINIIWVGATSSTSTISGNLFVSWWDRTLLKFESQPKTFSETQTQGRGIEACEILGIYSINVGSDGQISLGDAQIENSNAVFLADVILSEPVGRSEWTYMKTLTILTDGNLYWLQMTYLEQGALDFNTNDKSIVFKGIEEYIKDLNG